MAKALPPGDTVKAEQKPRIAAAAWWLRAEPDRLAEAMPELQGLMSRFEYVILESNSIAEHIAPDIYLFVDSGKATVKRMPPGG